MTAEKRKDYSDKLWSEYSLDSRVYNTIDTFIDLLDTSPVVRGSDPLEIKRMLTSILLNLREAHRINKPLAVGMSDTTVPDGYSRRYFRRIFDSLISSRLVVKRNGHTGRLTTFTATEILITLMTDLFGEYRPQEYHQDVHLPVWVRERVEYDYSRGRKRALPRKTIRHNRADYEYDYNLMNRYNSDLQRHDILLDNVNIADIYLRRILVFDVGIDNDDHLGGGRLYPVPLNSGPHWMSIGKKKRLDILIDGKQVEEIDFCELHPSLLHAKIGIQMNSGAYDVDGFERRTAKIAFNVMTNCSSSKGACIALLPDDKQRSEPKSELDLLTSARVHALVAGLEKNNPLLADCMYSDMGIRMQRFDSVLMLKVLDKCLNADIIVLPVHDSVVVPVDRADEVAAIISSTYTELTTFECKLERKRA